MPPCRESGAPLFIEIYDNSLDVALFTTTNPKVTVFTTHSLRYFRQNELVLIAWSSPLIIIITCNVNRSALPRTRMLFVGGFANIVRSPSSPCVSNRLLKWWKWSPKSANFLALDFFIIPPPEGSAISPSNDLKGAWLQSKFISAMAELMSVVPLLLAILERDTNVTDQNLLFAFTSSSAWWPWNSVPNRCL